MLTLSQKIEANAASRLTLPANTSPRDELWRYKNFLKVETHRLKILHRAGGEGREICHARSTLVDILLRYILQGVIASSPELSKKTPKFTLVATGGFGRALLNPHSDLDIMFLHESDMTAGGAARPSLSALVDGLLYSLWDLGLKVGHAVRTIEDCVSVGNGDMQSKTSLIEARRIMGDEVLFDRFNRTVLNKCVLGHESEYIGLRVDDQAARREKYGNSATMQEPNVKNGCGGLRDFQNLVWMAYFKYRTRSLAELQEKEMISAAEAKQLDRAYGYLLRVRTELHYTMNRSADILARSMQATVALNLGYHERSPSERLEVFMHDFYKHTRNIDLITRTVERRLALFPQKRSVLSPLKRIFRRPAEPEPPADGFRFVDGEILPANKHIFRDKPRRLMRVFLVAQQRGLKLHPDMTQLLRSQVSLIDNSFLRDEHVRESFLEILDQRGNVAPALRAMHEVGFLGKFLPEFGKLTCLVQHEFYHQYTADEHTLVCLQKLDKVWNSNDEHYARYAELFRQVERAFVLYLALLLHDAGKAYRTGRHEQIGGDIAIRVAKRLELNGAQTHSLRLLIENHLAMAQISQRRDLDDPATIESFARQIQSIENLNMLTLHTLADSTATSDHLWNGFKDSALWRLYHKTREQLSGGTEFRVAETRERELLIEEVSRIAPATFDPKEIQAHFNNTPQRYAQINDAHDILRDIAQVHRFIQLQLSNTEDNALAPIVSWHNEPDRGYTSVSVCTWDRERLFSKIAGCLTAAGLNILSAEIVTRGDGVIIDTFFVTDARAGSVVKREERENFEGLLHKVLTGAPVNLSNLMAKNKSAPSLYQSVEGERIPNVVIFDNDVSANRTVIDIQAEDRVGLLYDISHALTAVNLNIYLAKITTEKGAAIDSFYVTEHNGSKIINLARQHDIREKLLEAIGSPLLIPAK